MRMNGQQRVLAKYNAMAGRGKRRAIRFLSSIAIVTFNVVGELASADEIRLLGSVNGYPELCGCYSLAKFQIPDFSDRAKFVLDVKKKNKKKKRAATLYTRYFHGIFRNRNKCYLGTSYMIILEYLIKNPFSYSNTVHRIVFSVNICY